MSLTWIKTRIGRFARREDGTIALEAMIITPMMFWAFLSVFSMMDAFRTYNINQKAAYTIGDSISRETAPIDMEYITGTLQMFEYLSQSQGQSSLRVSSLVYNMVEDTYLVEWSQALGSMSALGTNDAQSWSTKLPVMPHNERVMLVETKSTYDPPFATGLERREIENFVFTRPRFAPRVCWEQCN